LRRCVIANPTHEILDFLLAAPTPQQVINLQASAAAQERIRYLLDGNRKNSLTDSEHLELDSYL
jgi:hypothetical protein